MLIKLSGRKAQSMVEFAILFGIVAMALMAMQVYVRRGLQDRVKQVVDNKVGGSLGKSFGQYEPVYHTSSADLSSGSTWRVSTAGAGGAVTREIQGAEGEYSRKLKGTDTILAEP